MGFPCKALVLEEDGAEIDDDEVLRELITSTIMALADGETWVPPQQKASMDAIIPTKNMNNTCSTAIANNSLQHDDALATAQTQQGEDEPLACQGSIIFLC